MEIKLTDEPNVAEFKNPFSKACVSKVEINLYKSGSIFREGKTMSATVRFTNGNTNGSQDFYDNDLKDLLFRIQAFIETL